MITSPLSSLHFLFHFCKNYHQAADGDDGCLMLILSSLTQGSGGQHVCGWMRLKGQEKAKKKKETGLAVQQRAGGLLAPQVGGVCKRICILSNGQNI